MTADPRTEAAAKALAEWRRDEVAFQPVRHDSVIRSGNSEDYYRKGARPALAAADAAALADEAFHARIATWIGRNYSFAIPSTDQVRMVLAALTALTREETP